jgi:glycosyltransferase involved in cell wall biosynthesis
MFQWVDKVNWDRVDKIILVSYAMHKKFSEKFPDQKHKVTVIPEAIPIEKFQYTPKEFRGDIGILCHLSPRKRVYELILVFYEMLKTRGDFHLHIAGDLVPAYGDYFDAIQSLVKKLGIEDQVTFYGEIFDAWNWYSKIDIFISNSYSEGLQVAPIEAMASGRYCLSHRWDGAEELLPENNLFYTDQDLQEKILAFCQLSSEEKQKSSRLMRELACEKFDINQTKAQIRRLIQDVALGKS